MIDMIKAYRLYPNQAVLMLTQFFTRKLRAVWHWDRVKWQTVKPLEVKLKKLQNMSGHLAHQKNGRFEILEINAFKALPRKLRS